MGIFDKEGTQAARASDYAIHQFKCVDTKWSFYRKTYVASPNQPKKAFEEAAVCAWQKQFYSVIGSGPIFLLQKYLLQPHLCVVCILFGLHWSGIVFTIQFLLDTKKNFHPLSYPQLLTHRQSSTLGCWAASTSFSHHYLPCFMAYLKGIWARKRSTIIPRHTAECKADLYLPSPLSPAGCLVPYGILSVHTNITCCCHKLISLSLSLSLSLSMIYSMFLRYVLAL